METEENCKRIIDAIFSFKFTVDRIDNNISKKLAYFLGEYYALQKILQKYPTALHKGGQGRYDIEIVSPPLKIEVKTSTLKEDSRIYPGIQLWGWTAETAKQQTRRINSGEKRFDFLIAVSLDTTWTQPSFHIFSWDEAIGRNPDNSIRGLANIKKRIHLFQTYDDLQKAREFNRKFPDKYASPTWLDEALLEEPNNYTGNWEKIS